MTKIEIIPLEPRNTGLGQRGLVILITVFTALAVAMIVLGVLANEGIIG